MKNVDGSRFGIEIVHSVQRFLRFGVRTARGSRRTWVGLHAQVAVSPFGIFVRIVFVVRSRTGVPAPFLSSFGKMNNIPIASSGALVIKSGEMRRSSKSRSWIEGSVICGANGAGGRSAA